MFFFANRKDGIVVEKQVYFISNSGLGNYAFNSRPDFLGFVTFHTLPSWEVGIHPGNLWKLGIFGNRLHSHDMEVMVSEASASWWFLHFHISEVRVYIYID